MRIAAEHITALCLALCTLLAVSCSRDRGGHVPHAGAGEYEAKALVLNVSSMQGNGSQTVEQAIDPKELMHSLRVIILGREDKVEYNEKVVFDEARATHLLLIKNLFPGRKTIYLIANEESVGIEGENGGTQTLEDLLAGIDAGDAGDAGARALIDGIWFKPTYTNEAGDGYASPESVPLSARYDNIDIPLTHEETVELDRKFYLVPAAATFTVNFVNFRDEPVKVEDFSIASVARNTYLIARPDEDAPLFDGYPTWMDWMNAAAAESQSNPWDPNLADRWGWVSDYELPGNGPSDIVYKYENTEGRLVPAQTPSNPGEMRFAGIRVPESMCMKAGNVQEYTMTFHIEGGPEDGFTATLPNLKSLFRNTHVWVTVRLTQKPDPGGNIEALVNPWGVEYEIEGGWEEVENKE